MSRHQDEGDVESALQRARREGFEARPSHLNQRGFGEAEFVDQHGFMLARDIRSLAVRAGIVTGARVLDLCCGPGGPGRAITRELGCDYLGVDADPGAVATARTSVGDLACRYETMQVPPVPDGPFDVVLLLETMLAFADKEPLLRAIRSALVVGGRFAFTVEEGGALSRAERRIMPAAETVWPVPLSDLHALLERVGLRVVWQQECSSSHRVVVDSLLASFAEHESAIAAQVGRQALGELLTAHRLWSEWLSSGRVRKFAFVTERPA